MTSWIDFKWKLEVHVINNWYDGYVFYLNPEKGWNKIVEVEGVSTPCETNKWSGSRPDKPSQRQLLKREDGLITEASLFEDL